MCQTYDVKFWESKRSVLGNVTTDSDTIASKQLGNSQLKGG